MDNRSSDADDVERTNLRLPSSVVVVIVRMDDKSELVLLSFFIILLVFDDLPKSFVVVIGRFFREKVRGLLLSIILKHSIPFIVAQQTVKTAAMKDSCWAM